MLSRLTANRNAVAGAVAAAGVVAYTLTRPPQRKEHVVVVGGGTAGVGVTAMLRNEGIRNVTVVEPSDTHYYQPLWTLVGGGIKDSKESARPMKSVIPGNAKWVQQAVDSIDPVNNQVTLHDGSKIPYDYLVVASGMQIDWDKIPGLAEALEKDDSGVVSIYDFKHSSKTWKTFQQVKDLPNPKFIFTMSPTNIKCAGAPQKIMWILEDTMRGLGKRTAASFNFWTPGAAMFGVPYYAEKLEKIRRERGVSGHFKQELVAIDGPKKIASFQNKDTGGRVEETFDMIHVAPHMSAPDFLKGSPISDAAGWVDVDKHTLQSTRYKNVFGIGDCTNTPNSKTAAAITAQAPVLVHNLRSTIEGKPVRCGYQGYASCPLIVARGQTIMAEFGYGGKIMETFGRETGAFPLKYVGTEGRLQRRFFYFLKEQLFPFVYWNLWTRGMWYGTTGIFKPGVRDDPTIRTAEK